MLEVNQTYIGDCLDVMQSIDDSSIDMVLCDLPYGVTTYGWDNCIDLRRLWAQYARVVKLNAAIVLTATQPFTTDLINSFRSGFKYCWVWDKNSKTNFLNAKKQPLRQHEDIAVFYISQPTYNPQGIREGEEIRGHVATKCYGNGNYTPNYQQEFTGYPSSILQFDAVYRDFRVCDTQKPVPLFEYLIKTYTNPGELVLDNCAGSGTTGVACLNTGRNFILIEKDEQMAQKCAERISTHFQTLYPMV